MFAKLSLSYYLQVKIRICPDFKWLACRILDPIQNMEHLQPNLFSSIQKPD